MEFEKNPYQQFLSNALAKCIPVNLQIELTKKCNLKCQFCYNEDNTIFIKTDSVIKAIDEATELGSFMLSLTGGEPLLHPDFYKIAEHSKRRGYFLIIQTNGVMINKNVAKKIAKLNPVGVDISLHGANENTHDFITGAKGSFKKTIKAIKNLRKLNCPVRIKVPVTKYNQNELEQIKEIVNKFGCNIVFDPFISPKLNGDVKPLDFKPDFNNLKSYIEYTLTDNEGDIIGFEPRKLDGPLCGMGRTLLAITAEGDVRACMRIPIELGNIYEESIIDTWKNSDKLKELRMIKRGDIISCRGCRLIEYCFICLGLQLLKVNNLETPYKEACENAILRKEFYEEKKIKKN